MSVHALVAYSLAMLVKDNSVLMLKRSEKSSFAPGCYSLPGGLVEKNESFKDALVRELQEELGIHIDAHNLQFAHAFYRKGTEHELVAFIFTCSVWSGNPINKEPSKHDQLTWISLDILPENSIIPAHRNALLLIKNGQQYSEYF